MNDSSTILTAQEQDERVLAALSHAAVLLPVTGIIAPILIWVTQKDKSSYVRFQALQAVAFHLLLIVIWLLGWGAYMVGIFGAMGFSILLDGSNGDAGPFFILPILLMCLLFLILIVFMVYGIVAAVMTFQGKPFRYLVIGGLVEQQQKRA
jgi:uncharacterized Tic20 family protein